MKKYELENKKISQEKLYIVGYHKPSNQFILEIVINWITWYSRFFKISEEEYNWFNKDCEKLDDLVSSLLSLNKPSESDRFIYSEQVGENQN